jgi:hypothetical protein
MEGAGVELEPFAVHDFRSDAAEVAGHARELGGEEGRVEPDRLHELGSAIGRGRGHADHRHGLDEPRAQPLEVGRLVLARGQHAQPRADGVGPHGDEQRAVVDVPHAEVGHEAHLVPVARLHDRIVQPGHQAQAGQRRTRTVDLAIGQDEHGRVAGPGRARLHGER